MKVRWSERASQHLEDIYDYIAGKGPVAALNVGKQSLVFTARPRLRFAGDYIEAQDKPDAVREVIEKLIDSAEALGQNPQMGRPSCHLGQRELIRAPFIVFYAIEGDVIDIRAVLHGKRKW
jgi:plasmid stabilization system protein ParE